MICQNCENGNHDQLLSKDEVCNCICHPGKEVVDGVDVSEIEGFPFVDSEGITSMIVAVSNYAVTHDHKDKKENRLCEFMSRMLEVSQHSNEFQKHLYVCKQLLHQVNRTTGLMQIYVTGVIIGLFLTRPEIMPPLDSLGKIDLDTTSNDKFKM